MLIDVLRSLLSFARFACLRFGLLLVTVLNTSLWMYLPEEIVVPHRSFPAFDTVGPEDIENLNIKPLAPIFLDKTTTLTPAVPLMESSSAFL